MAAIGRNHPCPCGSGKKYKRCCLPKDQAASADAARAEPARQTPPSLSLEQWRQLADAEWDDDGLDDASNRVVDLIQGGQLDQAEQAARDLLEQYPDVADGLERLAMVYEARKDLPGALAYYRKTLDFMTANPGFDPEPVEWIQRKLDKLEHQP